MTYATAAPATSGGQGNNPVSLAFCCSGFVALCCGKSLIMLLSLSHQTAIDMATDLRCFHHLAHLPELYDEHNAVMAPGRDGLGAVQCLWSFPEASRSPAAHQSQDRRDQEPESRQNLRSRAQEEGKKPSQLTRDAVLMVCFCQGAFGRKRPRSRPP